MEKDLLSDLELSQEFQIEDDLGIGDIGATHMFDDLLSLELELDDSFLTPEEEDIDIGIDDLRKELEDSLGNIELRIMSVVSEISSRPTKSNKSSFYGNSMYEIENSADSYFASFIKHFDESTKDEEAIDAFLEHYKTSAIDDKIIEDLNDDMKKPVIRARVAKSFQKMKAFNLELEQVEASDRKARDIHKAMYEEKIRVLEEIIDNELYDKIIKAEEIDLDTGEYLCECSERVKYTTYPFEFTYSNGEIDYPMYPVKCTACDKYLIPSWKVIQEAKGILTEFKGNEKIAKTFTLSLSKEKAGNLQGVIYTPDVHDAEVDYENEFYEKLYRISVDNYLKWLRDSRVSQDNEFSECIDVFLNMLKNETGLPVPNYYEYIGSLRKIKGFKADNRDRTQAELRFERVKDRYRTELLERYRKEFLTEVTGEPFDLEYYKTPVLIRTQEPVPFISRKDGYRVFANAVIPMIIPHYIRIVSSPFLTQAIASLVSGVKSNTSVLTNVTGETNILKSLRTLYSSDKKIGLRRVNFLQAYLSGGSTRGLEDVEEYYGLHLIKDNEEFQEAFRSYLAKENVHVFVFSYDVLKLVMQNIVHLGMPAIEKFMGYIDKPEEDSVHKYRLSEEVLNSDFVHPITRDIDALKALDEFLVNPSVDPMEVEGLEELLKALELEAPEELLEKLPKLA